MVGELVPVERQDGVTLYGRVLGVNGKLGQYEVHADHTKWDEQVYSDYKSAETKMAAWIGVQAGIPISDRKKK